MPKRSTLPYNDGQFWEGSKHNAALDCLFFLLWWELIQIPKFHSISFSFCIWVCRKCMKMQIPPETGLVIRTSTIKIAFFWFIPSLSVYSATFPSATSFVDAELASSIAQIKWLVHCTPYTHLHLVLTYLFLIVFLND